MDPSTSVWVVDTNPNIAPGLPALLGERARVGSTIYWKTGPLDTDWTLFPGSGGGLAPANATYITQTPDATLTNEQALSLLATGILKSTTGTGVISIASGGTDYEVPLTFSTGLTRSVNTITANLSTGISGGQSVIGGTGATENLTYSSTTNGSKGLHVWGTTSNMYFDEATGNLILGTTTPFLQAAVEVVRNTNSGVAFTFVNQSAGANAYTAFFLAQSPTLASGATFGTFLFSSGSGFGAPYTANAGLFELAGGAGNMHFWIQQNSGDYRWYTKTTFPAPSSSIKMELTNNGVLSVLDLGAAGTGRLVKAALTTGTLSIASASDVAGAITWPTAGQVLVSTGTTTAPAGDANVLLDTTGHEFYITKPGYQSWYNATGANYERVRTEWGTSAFAGADTWMLKSQANGTGTVRNMSIEAGAGNASLSGLNAQMIDVNGAVAFGIVGTVGSEQGNVTTTIARASSAGMVFDGLKFNNTITISGTTNITTATGVNAVVFAQPTYSGNGSAKTADRGATVYIANSPNATNSLTLTKPYSLWIDAGIFRYDGAIALGGGAAATLGTIGGGGPGTAAQNKWIAFDADGTTYYIPLWI